MAKGKEIQIGPWPQGINLLDRPDAMGDQQCPWINNFDVENSGILSPRRSIRHVFSSPNFIYLLGNITTPSNPNSISVLSGEVDSPAGGTITRLRIIQGNETPTVGAQFGPDIPGQIKAMVQYQNRYWYIPADPFTVGKYASDTDIATLVSVSAMPHGTEAFILKDRLFIIRKDQSEIHFSKATDFTVWAAPDGGVIKVNPGDRRPITKVVVLNNQLVIFKRDETYILSFNNSPTGDGTLRQVSPDQGAYDAITYNNELYCYNGRSVFKFVNGFFQDIGGQLNLRESARLDGYFLFEAGKLHIVGKTLIVGSGPNPAERARCFAMNLDTGAWSIYEFDTSVRTLFAAKSVTGRNAPHGTFTVFGDGQSAFYSMLAEKRFIGGMADVGPGSSPLPIKYEMYTKVYDFDDSMVWKRLYRWYLDMRFPDRVYGLTSTTINAEENADELRPINPTGISAVGDLIGNTRSFRFKSLQFGYVGTDPLPVFPLVNVGPTIRSIKAVVGLKAPVSTAKVPNN